MGKLLDWLIKTRWWVIGLTALLLIYRESMELPLNPLGSGQILEYFIYAIFLLVVGILVDLLLQANARQSRSFYLLDQKHKLSIDLAIHEDWNDLIQQLLQYPVTQASVDQVQLLVQNPSTNQFEPVGYWQRKIGERPGSPGIDTLCQQCLLYRQGFEPCQAQDPADKRKEYCLPINYGRQALALLRFKLKPGAQLTQAQDEIFKNIGDEMGVAIKAHQERKKVIEMQRIETSLAERRSVSHYLHDNLGQNLAYLCLKLDQMKLDQSLSAHQGEIEQMYGAANQSYEIVRNTLETYRPTDVPVLATLLAEHAKKVSKRTNLKIEIQPQGEPVFVPPEAQRAVFYVFQEALSNVEKHAQAGRVEIFLVWHPDQLLVKISDDGIGFDPQRVDREKHSGLESIFEHIANIHGKVDLVSSENSGTTLTISVPLSPEIVGGITDELSI